MQKTSHQGGRPARAQGPRARALGPFFCQPPCRDCGVPRRGARNRDFLHLLAFLVQQMTPKKSRLRGWDLSGEIRTEKLISIPASDVQNGWMATHLVTKRCDLGSLGVPGPASTPSQPGRLDPSWIQAGSSLFGCCQGVSEPKW